MNFIIEKQNEIKKHSKKGFTLVEVIVVLVILAILMAIAIPALTGYIDKAKERAAIAEAKTALTALQTISSQVYAFTGDNPLFNQINNMDDKIREIGRASCRERA